MGEPENVKTESNKHGYHCRGWQMKGYLVINILLMFVQILLDYPFLTCFLMINLTTQLILSSTAKHQQLRTGICKPKHSYLSYF